MSGERPGDGPDEFEGLPASDRRELMELRRAIALDGTPEGLVKDVIENQRLLRLLSHELDLMKESDHPTYLKIVHTIRDNYQKTFLDPKNEKDAENTYADHLDANEMLPTSSALINTIGLPGRSVLRIGMIGWLRGKPSAEQFLKILEEFHRYKSD
jgi:hypothetical protein